MSGSGTILGATGVSLIPPSADTFVVGIDERLTQIEQGGSTGLGVTAEQVQEAIYLAATDGSPLVIDLASGNATISQAQWNACTSVFVINCTANGRVITVQGGDGLRGVKSDQATNTKSFRIKRDGNGYLQAKGAIGAYFNSDTTGTLTLINSAGVTGVLTIDLGGTGATTAAGARTAFGLDKLYFAFDFGSTTMADGDTISFIAPCPLTLPASLAGSRMAGTVAATGSTVVQVKRATTSDGSASNINNATFTVAGAGTVASLGANSQTSILTNERVDIVGPATKDATLAGVRGVLTFVRA